MWRPRRKKLAVSDTVLDADAVAAEIAAEKAAHATRETARPKKKPAEPHTGDSPAPVAESDAVQKPTPPAVRADEDGASA